LAEALAAADQATQLAADQLDAMRASAPVVSDGSSRGDDGNTKPPSTRNSANAIEIHDDFGGESTTLQTRATGDENPFAKVESGSSIQSPWSFTSSSAQTGGEEGCANDAWALTESQDSAAASWSCTAPVIQSSPDDTAAWQCTEPTNADADKTPAGPATASTSKAQPASFIERYSHMFADVAAADEPQPPPKDASTTDMEAESRRASGPVPPATDATTAEGEEESIEQYMAKLLQRVRGDLPATTAAVPTEGDRPITAPKNFTAPLTAPSATANGSGDLLSPIGFDASKRKSSLPTPQTDLEALRALANESARRAISRHAVRKHRRTLITKIIVSTLAGVTSLWLLLESERWLNLQSITACVSMLVAAYWAAETVRTLLNSLRVSTSDETDHEIEELSAKLRSPLPIDLEGSRAWTTQPLNASSNEAPAERTLAESELKVES
jgi:hypothetical protein